MKKKIDVTAGEIFLVGKTGKTIGVTNKDLASKDFSSESFFPKLVSGDKGIAYSLDFSAHKTYFYAYSPVRSEKGEMLGDVIT